MIWHDWYSIFWKIHYLQGLTCLFIRFNGLGVHVQTLTYVYGPFWQCYVVQDHFKSLKVYNTIEIFLNQATSAGQQGSQTYTFFTRKLTSPSQKSILLHIERLCVFLNSWFDPCDVTSINLRQSMRPFIVILVLEMSSTSSITINIKYWTYCRYFCEIV